MNKTDVRREPDRLRAEPSRQNHPWDSAVQSKLVANFSTVNGSESNSHGYLAGLPSVERM